jgi:hypothetical protein
MTNKNSKNSKPLSTLSLDTLRSVCGGISFGDVKDWIQFQTGKSGNGGVLSGNI